MLCKVLNGVGSLQIMGVENRNASLQEQVSMLPKKRAVLGTEGPCTVHVDGPSRPGPMCYFLLLIQHHRLHKRRLHHQDLG